MRVLVSPELVKQLRQWSPPVEVMIVALPEPENGVTHEMIARTPLASLGYTTQNCPVLTEELG